MSWIKENKFIAALGGGTAVGAILLYLVGSSGSGKYQAALEAYQTAAGEVDSILKLPLPPTDANRDQKSKALGEYRKSTEALQAAFEAFRPKEIKNVTPQEFTDHLKAANEAVRAKFDDAGTKLPDAFLFCGFEKYQATLANGNTTGILEYQLAGVKQLMLDLAAAKPTELKNVYRPLLPEEEGKTYEAKPSDVTRPFPLEITFVGREKSVRDFLSALSKTDKQFVVVHTLRISNTKKDPPRTSDAKFDKPKETPAAGGAAGGVFGGGFVLPGEEPAAKPAEAKPAPAPEAAPKEETGRILSQVLGNEELQVFLRLDVMQFLPAKKLP